MDILVIGFYKKGISKLVWTDWLLVTYSNLH